MAEGGADVTQCDFMTCEKHPDKKVEIFCEKHVAVCCSTCAWVDHHECRPKPCLLEEAIPKFQDEQVDLIGQLMTCSDSCDDTFDAISKQIHLIEETELSVRDEFAKLKTGVIAKLDELEEKLTDDIDECLSDTSNDLKQALRGCEENKKSIAQLKAAIQLLTQTNDPSQVAAYVKMKQLIKSFDSERRSDDIVPHFLVSEDIHRFLRCSSIGHFRMGTDEYENVRSVNDMSGENEPKIDSVDDVAMMSDAIQDEMGVKPRMKQERSRSGISLGKIFRLFKFRGSPRSSATRTTTNPNPLPLAASGNIEDEEWFHGEITRDIANARLIGNGDYLLRAKPNQVYGSADYVLSVCSKIQHHAFIKSVKGGWKFKGNRFSSLQKLITHLHHSMTPLVSATHKVVLHTPISRRSSSETEEAVPVTLQRLTTCLDDESSYLDLDDLRDRNVNQLARDVSDDMSDEEEDQTSPYELWAPPKNATPDYEYCSDIGEIPWFHGCLSRENAEKRLNTDGDFLVREHREGVLRDYIISVYWSGPRHFKYRKNQHEQPHNPVQYFVDTGEPIKQTSGVKLWNAITRESWEIRNDDIEIQDNLAKDTHTDIHKGILRPGDKKVALYITRESMCDNVKKLFLGAAEILHEMDHPNIVRCLGIAMDYDPVIVVMEYVAGGRLRDFLRNEPDISSKRKVEICRDVANALVYLQERHCIHRNILAMNCLIGEDGVVKLSHFELCNKLDSLRPSLHVYKLPVKWTAPETIVAEEPRTAWSMKCDIWSLGILCWEVFSEGLLPYPGKRNAEAVEMVIDGYRLEPPRNTPPFISDLMARCWDVEPNRRPSAKHVFNWLNTSLRNPRLETVTLPPMPPPLTTKPRILKGTQMREIYLKTESAPRADVDLSATERMKNRPLPSLPQTTENDDKDASKTAPRPKSFTQQLSPPPPPIPPKPTGEKRHSVNSSDK